MSLKKEKITMGAIERNGYVFASEYSVINQTGAIHVYHHGECIDEITFHFQGKYPDHDLIEEYVNHYCKKHEI